MDELDRIAEEAYDQSEIWGHKYAVVKAIRSGIDKALAGSVESPQSQSHRLVYNKVTKTIDKVRNFDGLHVESFAPPQEFETGTAAKPGVQDELTQMPAQRSDGIKET